MFLRDLTTHGKLRLTGTDRVRFLNGLFTNDVAKLKPGEGCYAVMLTIKGKVLADALILCDEDALWLDLDGQLVEKVKLTLDRHLIVDDVVIEDHSGALDEVAIGGEGARAALEAALGVALPSLEPLGHVRLGGTRVVAVRELGSDGYRVIGGARQIADQIVAQIAQRTAEHGGAPRAWLAPDEAELLRIEAGEPRYGVDMGEDHLPIESRLDHAVSHTKGCYMGQEVIARVTARGQINRRLCGLKLAGSGAATIGAPLSTPEKENAGTITSSVVSPRFGPIALAYVHRSAWDPGTTLTLLDPAGARVATVVPLPFIA